ncbi:hypothetical protein OHB01_07515 [Microbispora hainanensis]|uniref:Lipoprotein n=1 Tax=Microbispora hainanensis TaxID=568844 RepID=A0ABZ1SN07_9ACTN|nr:MULTISPECIES: hypothetical protein [Microbispora]NJP26926.1 hypothetical protein [Microbispora sp. CL1-1]TQS11584.1 hypothetical protein FLW53_22570 [Microbispora sp. SCL1-1]
MRVARVAVTFLLVGGFVSSCGNGPTLQAATAELQKDLHRLEADGLLKNPLSKLRIVDRPDRDLPCDKDKFKRVLHATADYEHIPEDPVDNHLDHAERVMENTLSQELHYKITYDLAQLDWQDARLIEGRKDAFGLTVKVIVVPEAPTWRLVAETDCLPRS